MNPASLNRRIGRWHFYAGVCISPILLITALTGAILAFKGELERVFYRTTMFVQPSATRASYDSIRASAVAVAGDCRLYEMMLFDDPARAVVFTGGNPWSQTCKAYVDPYSGKALTFLPEGSFFDRVFGLHRTLLAGHAGQVVMEFMISWTIVQLLTGLYLRLRNPELRHLMRFKVRDGFTRARNLHMLLGVSVSAFLLIIALTSLMFTSIVGRAYLALLDKTESMPKSFLAPPPSGPANGRKAISLDQIVATTLDAGIYREMRVRFPAGEQGSFYIFAGKDSIPGTRGVLLLDQYSGETIERYTWEEFSPGLKLLLLGYPVHTGLIGGLATQTIVFLTCLATAGLTLTGAIMAWRHRGRSAVIHPMDGRDEPLPRWIVVVAVVLCVLLPSVGVTVLVLAALRRGYAMLSRQRAA